MKFSDLALSEEILAAVEKQGYETPSPIQEKAIPVILQGRDVLAGAQTGTGKTAAFTLPLLQNLGHKHKAIPRALVLAPTRELAAQVGENVAKYSENLPLKSTVIFGGVGIHPQIKAIAAGVDIIIATPGRLMDLHNQKKVDLSKIETFILDEADRMLDMGFIHDIRKIIKLLPKERQNLMFSATYSREIKALANGLLHKAEKVEVAKENATADTVTQKAYGLSQSKKSKFLANLIKEENWFQVLIFTRTKHGANRLSGQLEKSGIKSAAIHGNKSQNARTRALADFKKSKIQALVATDIAARGIDIDQLPHVVNFELPNVPEDYVHRIGRTGRAGAEGLAVSLVSPDEMSYLKGIEKLLKSKIELEIQESFKDRREKREQKKERAKNPRSVHAEAQKAEQNERRKSRNNRRRREGGENNERRNERNNESRNQGNRSESGEKKARPSAERRNRRGAQRKVARTKRD